jgi:hypothetical protein
MIESNLCNPTSRLRGVGLLLLPVDVELRFFVLCRSA